MEQVISGRADRASLVEVFEPAQHQDMSEQIIDRFFIGAGETVKYNFPTASAGYRFHEPTLEQAAEGAEQLDDPVLRAQVAGKDLADPAVQNDLRDPRTGEMLVDREGNRIRTGTMQPARVPEVEWPTTQPEMDAGSARLAEMERFSMAQEEALNATPPELRQVEPRTVQSVSPAEVVRGSGGTGEPVGDIPSGTQQPTPASQPGNPPTGEPPKPNPQTQPDETEQPRTPARRSDSPPPAKERDKQRSSEDSSRKSKK
jgi:hypothetical protein